ncbi:response regulator [Chloroflexota bacterium]
MNAGRIKIVIADDHAVVREGTRQLLEHEEDLEVVAEAQDGEEAVRLVGEYKPDVVILDIYMPVLDGVEATKRIKELYPTVAVLILSAYDDDQFVYSLIEGGAAGYLLKSASRREIIDAVRAVNSGESALHPSIARKVLNRFAICAKPGENISKELLSERELEVLKMAASGLSNQKIADNLFLSLRTIEAHLGHIFNKVQVGSRTEAVVQGLKRGWLTIEDIPD